MVDRPARVGILFARQMELSRAPPAAADEKSDSDDDNRGCEGIASAAIKAEEWASELIDLAPKLMCLTGTNVYKFSRERVLKKQWQNPTLKTLSAVGKGFISWTGGKPVRYISASAGPSEALERLM